MENLSKSDNRNALIGTIVFHAVLIAMLFLVFMRTPPRPPDEEGVLVALGYVDVGTGEIAQYPSLPASAPPPAQTANRGDEQVVTQDTEESIAIPPPLRQRTQTRPQTQNQDQTANRPPTTEPQRPQVDQRALFPGANQREATAANQGAGNQTGVMGRPVGSPDIVAAGTGQGVSFNLEGRTSTSLPMPVYEVMPMGTIVVSITVDRQGRVVNASALARGTTNTDTELNRQAEAAALRARFEPNLDAPPQQMGTITYHFIRQN